MKTWIYVQRISKATHVRMQKIVFLVPLFLFLLMTNVAYGQEQEGKDDNPRKDIELSDEERVLVKKNNDFALNLFRQARDNKSQVLSPLSITYALGMLNNGAAGIGSGKGNVDPGSHVLPAGDLADGSGYGPGAGRRLRQLSAGGAGDYRRGKNHAAGCGVHEVLQHHSM